MRLLVSGAIIGVVLVAFVFVWIYLASLGRVPVIHAPLEWISPPVRLVVLAVLAAVIGVVYFVMFPANRRGR
jgi:membrane-associated protease RseP (regulator of RpoE activity)